MNFEKSRLRTFSNWPENAPVDYHRIARAGFYYMGQNFEVQCFSCGGRISEWQYGDKVMAKHRLLDPRCPFVLNPVDSDNVPITETNYEPSQEANLTAPSLHLSDKSNYKIESERLNSFITWPFPSKIEGHRLAKAGFYYLLELDKVKCAFCGIECCNWEIGDDPVVEHRRHSSECSFLSSLSVDDVLNVRKDYCNFETEYGLDPDRMKGFGILNHRIPKHSKFMTEESRISSFEKWPKYDVQDPRELARAGFYYTGVGDKVRCYHCGGGLQKWRINDDPWVEHTKWFPKCDFIYLVKGEDFILNIKEITGKNLNIEEGENTSEHSANSLSPTIDDNVLHMLMTSAPVLAALDLGLDMSRIKQVLRERLENHTKGFNSEDELIAAVLDAQFNEPVADLTEESWIPDSIANFCSSQPPLNLEEETSSSYNQLVENEPYQYNNNEAFEEHLSIISDVIMNTTNDEESNNTAVHLESGNEIVQLDNNNDELEKASFTILTSNKEKLLDQNKDNDLKEENRRLKEAKLCKICMDQDVNIVFLPCGHLVSCSCCAANILDCPVCRQMIKGTVRTFLA